MSADYKQLDVSKANKGNGSPVRKVITDVLILLSIGLVYYLLIEFTYFKGFQCPTKTLFHLDCPACGISRMFIAMFHLDFVQAFKYNRLIFITLPYIVYEIIYMFYINAAGKRINKINEKILYVYMGLLVVYGILRNIFPI